MINQYRNGIRNYYLIKIDAVLQQKITVVAIFVGLSFR